MKTPFFKLILCKSEGSPRSYILAKDSLNIGMDSIIPAKLQQVSDLVVNFRKRVLTGYIDLSYVPVMLRNTCEVFIPRSGNSKNYPGEFSFS